MRAAALVAASMILLVGCRAPKSAVGGVRTGSGGVVVRTDATGWRTKNVVAKRPPEALLADDGTMCRVAPDRFRDTAEGTAVYCNWQ